MTNMSANVFNKLLELITILHNVGQRQQSLSGEQENIHYLKCAYHIIQATKDERRHKRNTKSISHLSDLIDHVV